MSKVCVQCEWEKPLSRFYKYRHYEAADNQSCKMCTAKQRKGMPITKCPDIPYTRAAEVKEYNKEYARFRRDTDPLFKLRNLIREHTKRYHEGARSKSTEEILGCSIKALQEHLDNSFEANYGMPREWKAGFELEIDHIIPLATAKDEATLYKLGHHTNLQYLFEEHNQDKKDKLDWKLPE